MIRMNACWDSFNFACTLELPALLNRVTLDRTSITTHPARTQLRGVDAHPDLAGGGLHMVEAEVLLTLTLDALAVMSSLGPHDVLQYQPVHPYGARSGSGSATSRISSKKNPPEGAPRDLSPSGRKALWIGLESREGLEPP